MPVHLLNTITKVYRCQINRQAVHEVIKNEICVMMIPVVCSHLRASSFGAGNNNILICSVNYPQDMFAGKLLNESTKEKPHSHPLLCCSPFLTLYILWCLSPDALNRSWQTLGKDQALRQPDTAETVTWEGRHTAIWWFSQKYRQRKGGVGEGGEREGRVLWHSKVHHSQTGLRPACHERY